MIIIETFEPGCQPRHGQPHRAGSTVHDLHTPVAIPQRRSHPRSLSHRQRPGFADGDPRHHLRPTKPAAPNARSPRRSHSGQPTPAPAGRSTVVLSGTH
jgi:hypothetical protein